ncbi:hypothetical protein O6H91_09G092100 [Diphasiastrum complanatum]|uniref:Uncharacterized protein n=3 Tax=Diphasiastrum complanatum TaxID=34168 RepID=A0ACC2CS27_DIPCM|nr:hypothetical protein O6H91_09G092100 [Diphasiastrum complanatum]KAJ7544761.1 hypothetical protein O6H91_09G092100 [Diphasiastrum complanatum]KAJ7544762.1 hypothetical protein O6H91_09G092100 [Diphasiastrum complanatum]
MGRGVSSGGGQSSLGYLFKSNEEPKTASAARAPVTLPHQSQPPEDLPPAGLCRKESPVDGSVSTGVKKVETSTAAESDLSLGRSFNNYHRAEGQNTGNFITDRPSTKVHSAPGGGSSLGYLFGPK